MKKVIVIVSTFFASTPPSLALSDYITSTSTIKSDDGTVEMTDHVYSDGKIERRYERGNTILYRNMVRPTSHGLYAEITAGHAMQRGSFSMESGQLTVKDPQGRLLWSEAIKAPLCLPELRAELCGHIGMSW